MDYQSVPLPIQAEFNSRLTTYLFWYGVILLIGTIVGIVLLPFWLLGLGTWYTRRYLDHIECELTERYLRFKKGILYQVETTIPLDNIQDLTFKEGPLLRYFDLSVLQIETAGNSGQGGKDMTLIGIRDAAAFRNRVIAQRERITGGDDSAPSASGSDGALQGDRIEQLLIEIRDALRAQNRTTAERE